MVLPFFKKKQITLSFNSIGYFGRLGNYYNSSKYEVIKEIYPNSKINIWEYPPVPGSFWSMEKNRLKYIKWLGKKLNFHKDEDWYKLKIQDLENNCGMGMLTTYYDNSKIKMVKHLFPNFDWKEWFFDFTPSGFWNDKRNRVRYMEWVGQKYNFKEKLDWYKLTNKHFEDLPKGESFLIYNEHSPIKSLKEYIPEIDWKEWLFDNPPMDFWSNLSNVKRYLNWLGEQLGFKKPSDWYNLTQNDLRKYNGGRLEKMEVILRLLEKFSLNIIWKSQSFIKTKNQLLEN